MFKDYTVEIREQDKATVGDARQRRYLLLYIFIRAQTSLFQSIFIFSPLSSHPSLAVCLSLTVPSSRFPPSNILLTHNCGTLSPVLPINPHHRHLGPLSRLPLNVHSKLSKSRPFRQGVPEHFSQAMRPAAEHAFYCTDRLVVYHALLPAIPLIRKT